VFLKNPKKKNRKLFKNRVQKNPAVSVRVDKKTKTIFLGEKKWKFEFTKTDVRNFFQKNIYRISILTIFSVSVISVSVSSTSKASVAQLYAGACLGGWENPRNAEGAPQVFDGSEEVFSASNSAILKNRMSEIFCGNFRAEVEDKSAVKKVVLKLSWKMGEETGEAPLDLGSLPSGTSSTSSLSGDTGATGGETETTEPSEENPEKKSKKGTTVIESGDFVSSLQDILDAPNNTPVDFTLTPEEEKVPESDPEAPAVEVETPLVQPAEEAPEANEPPAVEESVPEESAPAKSEPGADETRSEDVSFFRKIIKTVWAAEVGDRVVAPTPEPEVSPEVPLEESKPVAIESVNITSGLQDFFDTPVYVLTPLGEETKEESVAEEINPEETLDEVTPEGNLEAETASSSSEVIPPEGGLVLSLQDVLDTPVYVLTPLGEEAKEESVMEEITPEELLEEEATSSDSEIIFVENEDFNPSPVETSTISIDSDTITLETEVEVSDSDKVKSDVPARDNDFLEVEYTLDSVSWQHLGFVGSDNWKDIEFELPIVEWSELEKLQVRIKNLPTLDKQPTVYLDSMWIEVIHSKERILRPAKLENLSLKNGFSVNDELKFDFEFEEKEATGMGKLLKPVKDLFSGRKFNVKKVQLVNMYGDKEDVENLVEYDGKNKVSITLNPKKRSLKPGKYTLETYIKIDDDEEIIKQQDFYLGVLAINVNKSVYVPREKAHLQMGALTDDGHTICDADLWMSVTDPEGKETDFSTEDGSINLSGKCSGDSFVNVPDYFAYYDIGDIGTYNMKLINLDSGQEIGDSFEVKNKVSFDVERTGPTRIFPPAKYQVTMSIVPDQDFNGDIVEYVPDSFEITNTSLTVGNGSSTVLTSENITVGKSEKEENTTEIVWSANIKKGETCVLSYEFDAPDISPEFYLLGPLEFYE